MNERQIKAFRHGIECLSPREMREILFEIVTTDHHSIEEAITFAFDIQIKIGDKIKAALLEDLVP